MVETTAPGIGGNDTISIGSGDAIVIGGTGRRLDHDRLRHELRLRRRRLHRLGRRRAEPGQPRLGRRNAIRRHRPRRLDDAADGGDDTITIGSGQRDRRRRPGRRHDHGRLRHERDPRRQRRRSTPPRGQPDPFGDAADHDRPRRDDGARHRRQRHDHDRHRQRDRHGRHGRRHDHRPAPSTNFVFGDDGYITLGRARAQPGQPRRGPARTATRRNIDLVASTTPADGGNDTITIGAGKAIVVGGLGNDTITGGTGHERDPRRLRRDLRRRRPTRTASATCRSRSAWSRRPRPASAATTRSRSAPAARS